MSCTKSWTPCGYARFGSLATSITIGSTTPTAGTAYSALVDGHGNKAIPNHAILSVETQSIRIRDDGTAPTTTEGELIAAGAKQFIEDSPDMIAKAKIIETTASASVTVRYYI